MSNTLISSELLVSSKSKLTVFNQFRGSVLRQVDIIDDIHFIKRGKLICMGNSNGKLMLSDPSSLKVEHTLDAHSGGIAAMDVSGYYLVSCGYTPRLLF